MWWPELIEHFTLSMIKSNNAKGKRTQIKWVGDWITGINHLNNVRAQSSECTAIYQSAQHSTHKLCVSKCNPLFPANPTQMVHLAVSINSAASKQKWILSPYNRGRLVACGAWNGDWPGVFWLGNGEDSRTGEQHPGYAVNVERWWLNIEFWKGGVKREKHKREKVSCWILCHVKLSH